MTTTSGWSVTLEGGSTSGCCGGIVVASVPPPEPALDEVEQASRDDARTAAAATTRLGRMLEGRGRLMRGLTQNGLRTGHVLPARAYA